MINIRVLQERKCQTMATTLRQLRNTTSRGSSRYIIIKMLARNKRITSDTCMKREQAITNIQKITAPRSSSANYLFNKK